MSTDKPQSSTPRTALQSLHDRFIGDDPEKVAEYERAKAEMSREDAEELAAEADRLTAEVAECRVIARSEAETLRKERDAALAEVEALTRSRDKYRAAFLAANGLLWMARDHAASVGDDGPEMDWFEEAVKKIASVLGGEAEDATP